ncbi:MAG: 6-bladed beta-propeller [Longimicrobiales bacterium]
MQRRSALLLWPLVLPLTLSAQRVIDLPAADRLISVRSESVYKVGGDLAEGWAQFSQIDAVAFDSAGQLYALDRHALRLIVIDARGRFVRNVGGRGQGPGEFAAVSSFAAFPDGSLVVRDPIKEVFIRYDAEGKHAGDVRVGYDHGSPGALAPVGRDALVALTQIFWVNGEATADVGNRFGPATDIPLQRIALARPSTRLITRAWLQPRPPRPAPRTPHGLATLPRWTAAPDGRLALADSITYEIDLFDAAGRAYARVRRALPLQLASPAFREWARGEERAKLSTKASGQARTSAVTPVARYQSGERDLALMTFADHIQLIQKMRADWQGRIWIERAPNRAGEPGLLDLLTFDGRYLGTLAKARLPDAFGPNGLVAYIQKDEFESPVILVQRLHVTATTQ